MDKLINDRLRDNLSRLKLTRAAEVLDTMVSRPLHSHPKSEPAGVNQPPRSYSKS